MSTEVTQLEYCEDFAEIFIANNKFRNRFKLPCADFLVLLNDTFMDAVPDSEETVEVASQHGNFVVWDYSSNPGYSHGRTTYHPSLYFWERLSDNEVFSSQLHLSFIGAEEKISGGYNYRRLDPQNTEIGAYKIRGSTWTFGHEIITRIQEEDRMLRFGRFLVEEFQNLYIPGKDLSYYQAKAIVAA